VCPSAKIFIKSPKMNVKINFKRQYSSDINHSPCSILREVIIAKRGAKKQAINNRNNPFLPEKRWVYIPFWQN